MIVKMDDGGSTCRISLGGTISSPKSGETAPDPADVASFCKGRPALVSLAEADFVDSSGIGWLLQCDKTLQAAGAKMHLHSIPPNIQQVFTMLKLHKVLTLCNDEADAISRSQIEG